MPMKIAEAASERHVLAVMVDNEPGILAKITGLFTARDKAAGLPAAARPAGLGTRRDRDVHGRVRSIPAS